jgi:guanylate kinase
MTKGKLYIISAPSGAGKTSLVSGIVKEVPRISKSVSHTTRPIRPNEINGISYYFIEKSEFESMLRKDMFLEHAEVFDNSYGSSRVWIEEQRAKGIDIILEIDWQGARQVRSKFFDAISIYILPPSIEILEQRLKNRLQDKPEVIEQRMKEARQQMLHYTEYDYLIINDKFEDALEGLKSIILAMRLERHVQEENNTQIIQKLLHGS